MVMKRILLNIRDNETGKAFKCNIIESEHGWNCVLYQENFRFRFIKHKSLIDCLEKLSQYLEPIHDITIVGQKDSDDIYVAILNGYVRIHRSERILNRKMMG